MNSQLQSLRERYKISRPALARELHLKAPITIWRWETGRSPCDPVQYGPTLAAIFETSFFALFPDTDPQTLPPMPPVEAYALRSPLLAHRLRLGWTREAVARKVHIKFLTLYRLEYHREACPADVAQRLARLFRVAPVTLCPALAQVEVLPQQEEDTYVLATS